MQILELNDHELTLYSKEGSVVKREPAATAVVGNDLVFGAEALSQGRIHPQGFNNRYLGSATAEPLPSPMGPAHNFADLVYQQLATYELQRAPLVFLTPSHFNNEQLGLMLGICQELKVEVRGFIDSALLQATVTASASRVNILDIEWHRLTMTTIERSEGQASVAANKVWEGRGINHLIEGWMGVIADEFMHRTRFDPLHRGDTEQQLFQQTYAWLTGDFSPRIVVSGTDNDRELEIQRERVLEKTQQRLEGIELDTSSPLYLSERTQRIPDIQNLLRNNHEQIHSLSNGWVQHIGDLCDELPSDRVTRLTKTKSRSDISATPDESPALELATHLLDTDHIATPLNNFADLTETPSVGERVTHQQKTYVAIKVR